LEDQKPVGWLVRGLGGIVKMLEDANEEKLQFNDQQKADLHSYILRLSKLQCLTSKDA
jgi:hypothetical protein